MAHVQDELDVSRAETNALRDDGSRVVVGDAPTKKELRLVPWAGDGPDPLDDTPADPAPVDGGTVGLNPANHASLEGV